MFHPENHAPPHVHVSKSTQAIMTDVCLSLVPPAVAAVWFFGLPALWLILTGLFTACVADRLSARLFHRTEPFNGSAAVTGLLLSLSCPAGTPLWLLALGCVLAIILFRDAFGGIGANLLNPAMAARAVLFIVFPAFLTGYGLPDAVSAATPLAGGNPSLPLLILGRTGGSIGETSALLLLPGAVYLWIRRVIRWPVPILAPLAFCAVTALCGGDVLRQLLSGSFLFGTVYIFTDYTGKPTTPIGEILFSLGVGAACACFRQFGRYPEGVCFAILLMNLLTPLLEQLTTPRVYGTTRRRKTS